MNLYVLKSLSYCTALFIASTRMYHARDLR
jgi:hypothetical protein